MLARNDLEHSVLLVDDDVEFADAVRRTLVAHGIANISIIHDGAHVMDALVAGNFSVVLLDWVMPRLGGADLLPQIVQQYPHIPVAIMSGVGTLDNVVGCIKQGAYDYITKPLDTSRLVSVVQKAFTAGELAQQNRKLSGYLQGEPLERPECFAGIVTCCERMQSIFKVIEAIRDSRQPVLITGETGVGKGLFAAAIHRTSGLPGPMITMNVAGMDDTDFSNVLFGSKYDVLAGAGIGRIALIEQARNGTLFLDEIGELAPASQAKLLRLILQNEFCRVDSDLPQKSTVRIVAASNADFGALLASGRFRPDLYHRISANAVQIPALRQRPEDILPLCEHYALRFATELHRPVPRFSRDARLALRSHHFPGNVRELISRVHHAVVHCTGGVVQLRDFPGLPSGCGRLNNAIRRIGSEQFVLHGIFPAFPTFDDVELLLAEEAMGEAQGNRSAAAELLGITRPTLQRKLEQLAGIGRLG